MAVPAGNLRSNPFSCRRIAIEDRNSRACRGKGAACGGTNPVAAAGDKGDFSTEIFGHRTFLSNPGASRWVFAEIGIGIAVMPGANRQRNIR